MTFRNVGSNTNLGSILDLVRPHNPVTHLGHNRFGMACGIGIGKDEREAAVRLERPGRSGWCNLQLHGLTEVHSLLVLRIVDFRIRVTWGLGGWDGVPKIHGDVGFTVDYGEIVFRSEV